MMESCPVSLIAQMLPYTHVGDQIIIDQQAKVSVANVVRIFRVPNAI